MGTARPPDWCVPSDHAWLYRPVRAQQPLPIGCHLVLFCLVTASAPQPSAPADRRSPRGNPVGPLGSNRGLVAVLRGLCGVGLRHPHDRDSVFHDCVDHQCIGHTAFSHTAGSHLQASLSVPKGSAQLSGSNRDASRAFSQRAWARLLRGQRGQLHLSPADASTGLRHRVLCSHRPKGSSSSESSQQGLRAR